MVPKQGDSQEANNVSFRAVLFRMVPKPNYKTEIPVHGFRAVLFRMVPKRSQIAYG